ncbi:hypothetical protein BH11MYX4_BH11MYX4_55650 [soil metagenome]
MTIPSRRERPRKLARPAAAMIVTLGCCWLACAPPPQRKPLEMTPIGTVPVIERTAVEPDAGATTAPNSGTTVSAKEAACTVAEVEQLADVLRNCDAPMPKGADVPSGLAEKLELSVASSAPTTTPGGRVEVTLTLKNKTNDSVTLYFVGEPKPRFEVEAFDAKGARRVEMPKDKAPKAAYPPQRPVKASRIILTGGGSARIRVPWEAVKTRWAPEKAKTWEGRGPARAVFANLPYGKYQLRVVMPLIMVEKGELDLPKVGVDVTPP